VKIKYSILTFNDTSSLNEGLLPIGNANSTEIKLKTEVLNISCHFYLVILQRRVHSAKRGEDDVIFYRIKNGILLFIGPGTVYVETWGVKISENQTSKMVPAA
jgi:hypothetical protein